MPNRTYALEWLELARKNLETADLLNKQDHYTDIIAIEIHQTIEKSMKAILAYNGIKIPKTHDLMILYEYCNEFFELQEDPIDNLLIISDYYESKRYPGPNYNIPSKSEIARNISSAHKIYKKVDQFINA